MKQLLMMGTLLDFINRIKDWVSLRAFGISDVVEIFIISVVVYYVMRWIQMTRAWTLFKGILLLLVFALLAELFQLDTISYIMSRSLGVGIMAVIIIFQPELRRALEQLGRGKLFEKLSFFSEFEEEGQVLSEKTINEIVRASFEMGRVLTGALIVIENQVALGDYERTGITVDALVSSQLLINIFEKNTPLHDGAVIIRGNRVVSATCYLPLTESLELNKELGTRHRAAVGISEVSDSVTVVVSEETGHVSLAKDGKLYRNLDQEEVREKMTEMLITNTGSNNKNMFSKWKEMLNNEKSAKK